MKQAMINYMQQEKNDELYTPDEAIIPILKYLDHNLIYWECEDFDMEIDHFVYKCEKCGKEWI